jgi:hypothetical protein
LCVDQAGDHGAAAEVDGALVRVPVGQFPGGSDREHRATADGDGFLPLVVVGIETLPHAAVYQ